MKLSKLMEELWNKYKKYGDLEIKASIYGCMSEDIKLEVMGVEKYACNNYFEIELPIDGTKKYKETPSKIVEDVLRIEDWIVEEDRVVLIKSLEKAISKLSKEIK